MLFAHATTSVFSCSSGSTRGARQAGAKRAAGRCSESQCVPELAGHQSPRGHPHGHSAQGTAAAAGQSLAGISVCSWLLTAVTVCSQGKLGEPGETGARGFPVSAPWLLLAIASSQSWSRRRSVDGVSRPGPPLHSSYWSIS